MKMGVTAPGSLGACSLREQDEHDTESGNISMWQEMEGKERKQADETTCIGPEKPEFCASGRENSMG